MNEERVNWWDVFRGREPRSDDALKNYDERTLVIWLPVSFIYLAAIILQVWGRPSWDWWLSDFDWFMSFVFAADYAVRVKICKDRRKFVTRYSNIADLLVIATPLLGYVLPKGWSGLARLLRIVRLCVIAKRVWDGGGHRIFEAGQVKWVGILAGAVVFLATLALWAQEIQHYKAPIQSPWDAGWWAIVTMFTVGYGDMSPHSGVGKVAALVVMFAGIALFSWVTGALASRFVSSESEVEAMKQRNRMEQTLSDMTRQMEDMQRTIATLSNGGEGQDGRGPRLPGVEQTSEDAAQDAPGTGDMA